MLYAKEFYIICYLFLGIIGLEYKSHTVYVAILARNKEHTLPYFLTLFENLSYPKNRISVFIRSECNEDNTADILEKWIRHNTNNYHSVDYLLNRTNCNVSPTNWTDARFENVIKLKNEALLKARKAWADYIWFIDADAFLIDPLVLNNLITEGKPVSAPMLNSLGTYSNYWCGMTDKFWYNRTEEYLPILERKQVGCFSVPMVHSCVLIDLTVSLTDQITFKPSEITGYNGPLDDIIAFAISCKNLNLSLFVCNNVGFGIIPPPLNDGDSLSKDDQHLLDVKLAVLVEHDEMPVSPSLSKYVPMIGEKDMIGFDNIYLINLVRRKERRERMIKSFNLLELDYEIFDAVDGSQLSPNELQKLGIKQLDNFKDPWAKRDMTYGEIGCFLSHYFIWKDIVEHSYDKVIVFEDDIRFEPYFHQKLTYMMKEADLLNLEWDLIYLGRKKLQKSDEPYVEGSNMIVHVDYSYWTLCYVITLEGAKKLLAPNPLNKIIPVDEYIPIIFNRHPEIEWMENFKPRNLNAFSAEPLLVHPTHYTGEKGYFSDTETSSLLGEEKISLDLNKGNTSCTSKDEL